MYALKFGAAALLSMLNPPEDSVRLDISGREMVTLRDREDVIRGTCDGRPASATITKAYYGRQGSLVLATGRMRRELPSSFLGGRLFTNSPYAAGLACDGRRLEFNARTVRVSETRQVVIDVQSAILDLRTGEVRVSPLRTMSDDEVHGE